MSGTQRGTIKQGGQTYIEPTSSKRNIAIPTPYKKGYKPKETPNCNKLVEIEETRGSSYPGVILN